MKVHILYLFKEGPFGGGNQFLKALKKYFIKFKVYEQNPKRADVILFNSHHEIKNVLKLKLKNPNKIFIHRIDGPIYLIRNNDLNLDLKIYQMNNLIADGTIFQSEWSKNKNHSAGLRKNKFETVIHNASDPAIFYPIKKDYRNKRNEKIKLIATSWSSNYNKGFDLYQFLDENLDFNQFVMIFVGNSPIKFKNIKYIKPVNSYKLAKFLRESDIFIIGSKKDPCSNSLIEALSCGLPSITLNDGGHPELIKNGGEIYNNFVECLEKIQLVKENYDKYKKQIKINDMEETARLYLNFIISIMDNINKGFKPKKLSVLNYFKFSMKSIILREDSLKYLLRNELSRIISSLKDKLA